MKILRPNKTDTADAFARGCGVINIASSEMTSWHGFAAAIVAGMKQRAIAVETEQVTPIETADIQPRQRGRAIPGLISHACRKFSGSRRYPGARRSTLS